MSTLCSTVQFLQCSHDHDLARLQEPHKSMNSSVLTEPAMSPATSYGTRWSIWRYRGLYSAKQILHRAPALATSLSFKSFGQTFRPLSLPARIFERSPNVHRAIRLPWVPIVHDCSSGIPCSRTSRIARAAWVPVFRYFLRC